MPDSSSYRPTVEQVGAVLRTRTKAAGGRELGTFDDTTRPTGDEVESLIDLTLSGAAAALGQDIPAHLWDGVAMLVAIRTANVIQASYWPEQVNANSAVFDYWTAWYDEGMAVMVKAIRAFNVGDEDGADGSGDLPLWGDETTDFNRTPGAEAEFADLWNSWVRSPAALSLSYDQLPLWMRRSLQI